MKDEYSYPKYEDHFSVTYVFSVETFNISNLTFWEKRDYHA